MAAPDIRHSGTILRIESAGVVVRIVSQSACGSCAARAACGLAEATEKEIEVAVADPSAYAVGEQVEVGVRRNLGMKAVAIAYGGALAVLLAALFVTVGLLGRSEGEGIAATVAAVALYYAALWLLRDKIAHTIQFTITKHP